jgi:hypothetical protein
MASTDINGTYSYMYLVTPDELSNGNSSHGHGRHGDHGGSVRWDLVNDGSGSAAVNPVASQVTISGAPHESGGANSSPFQIDVANGDKFTFVSTAETTTFGQGFIVKDTASGQFYFITNTAYNGAANPFAAALSPEHGAPPPPESAPCFMAGTRIATPSAEVAVETLQVGDLVLTADGRSERVMWIGRRLVSRQFADPLRVLPIRIKSGALSDAAPIRDLLLSPDHAILVDGVLVQAGALVNGSSILRETSVPDAFTYYHVELDSHSLILAENVPSETFIDFVDRRAFDNWADHQAAYPEGKPIVEMDYPRAKAHRQVPVAMREALLRRAMASFGSTASSAA